MNENLNLVELLKDCPKGTPLYSTLYGEVYLKGVDLGDYPISFTRSDGCSGHVTSKGVYRIEFNGECTLFPSKDQRDWSKWHRPFIDGDVVTYKLKGWLVAFIYKERISTTIVKSHFTLYIQNMGFGIDDDIVLKDEYIVFATEEEKRKLFNAIKANGYRWNAKTKTLKKLIIPKFKVGNTIRTKNGLQTYEVTNVTSEYYSVRISGCVGLLPVKDQDDYILIPNKFDPNTLIPFESKVLVRDANHFSWRGSIYTHRDGNNFYTVNGTYYLQCIPYNDDTAYLIGTCKIAPDYYRYWDE